MHYSDSHSSKKFLSSLAPFAGLSITGRTLAIGIPLLGGLLLVIFWITGRLSDDMINRAIARNARLQALVISHEFERIIDETRNQLLVLAAGNMDKGDMIRRLKIRPLTESARYRELAFLGVSPEDRFLLLNYGGEVITVPTDAAREARLSPFQSFAVERRPGHVMLGEPLEVVYSMVPVDGVMQSLSLFVMRLTTPVYNADGVFQGMLILSLDVTALRDTLSLFSSSRSPVFDESSSASTTRSMFFDPQGWILFQSESAEAKNPPLSTDGVRSGIRGDFGRPSFSSAFRPAPEHEEFWAIVSEVQAGRSGNTLLRGRFNFSAGQVSQQNASYAPLYYKSSADATPSLVGGVAFTETSYAGGTPSFHLLGVYAICSLVALFCLAVALYYMGRWLARPITHFAQAVRAQGEAAVPARLEQQPIPLELSLVQNEVNLLLERIKAMHEETLMREAAVNAQWQRQPMPFATEDSLGVPPEDILGFVGESPTMQDLRIHIHKAASVFADVLLIGETGTGKEMAADAIHRQSGRSNGPFISINCGALDENLLMDTLFGHVKGAFTEARGDRKGAFLAAEGGTLMLDEIANASPKVQQALLRALAIRRIRPLGSDAELPFNARIIAATNVDLLQMAKDLLFREDLFYRLAVITIKTPPLRDHKEDIPLLTHHFLRMAAHEQGITPPQLSKGALDRLVNYDWPGNVREFKNVLIRAMAFSEGSLIFTESIVFGDTALPKVSTSPVQSTNPNPDSTGKNSQENSPAKVPSPSQPPVSDVLIEDRELNPRQLAALPAILSAGSVSRQEYQNIVGGNLSMRTAQYDLQELVRLGILLKQGRGPALRYTVALSCPLP